MTRFIFSLLAILITCQVWAVSSHRKVEMIHPQTFFLNKKEDRPSGKYSLHLQKIDEEETLSGPIPIYHLRIDGLPKGKKFQIANRNCEEKTYIFFSAQHIGDGQIVSTKGATFPPAFPSNTTPMPSFQVMTSGYCLSETQEILLIDPDTNSIDAVCFCSFPFEETAIDGAKLSMTVLSLNPFIFSTDLENFVPGEKVQTISAYSGERVISEYIIPENGKQTCIVVADDGKIDSQSDHFYQVIRNSGSLKLKYNHSNLTKLKHFPITIIGTLGQLPPQEDIEDAKANVQAVSNDKLKRWGSK